MLLHCSYPLPSLPYDKRVPPSRYIAIQTAVAVGTFEVVCFITKATGQYPSKKLGKGGSPPPSLSIVTASSPNECRFGVRSVTVKGVKV